MPRKTDKRTSTKKEDENRPDQDLYHGFEHYPPAKVYRLLEPGPVLLVSTGSLAEGTHNVMTLGFHTVLQHESPPLLGITLGPWDASFALLQKHKQCVLAVPEAAMAALAVDIGNCSADDDDLVDAAADSQSQPQSQSPSATDEGGGRPGPGKWGRFGLEAVAARRVRPPLVGGGDVIANVECEVEDARMVRKYNLWVLRPVKAWLNPARRPGEGGRMFHHRGDGTFVVDGEVLDLKERMTKWQILQD